jgi:hypothetical protein
MSSYIGSLMSKSKSSRVMLGLRLEVARYKSRWYQRSMNLDTYETSSLDELVMK